MKLLHTSDWHLGRSLYGKKRHDEFAAFLEWLAVTIEREQIDVLLVAGDVFDNSTPGNRIQELYYTFLCRVATSSCRHVVITAGNHDSPTFLDAPRTLLRALRVHVVGTISDSPEDEVIILDDTENENEDRNRTVPVIICAVPYLRDSDLRLVTAGESIDEKYGKLTDGIKQHYAEVCACAERKREELLLRYTSTTPSFIPIIAMGHLFTAGGRTVEGDGVRELYVGSLAHIGFDEFPSCIDYFALGHLHIPQIIGGKETIRYSGSPLPMGFGEANQAKSVVIINCNDSMPAVTTIPVPVFQRLVSLVGTVDELCSAIDALTADREPAWLEIRYEGEEIISDLRERLEAAVGNAPFDILRIGNRRIVERALERTCTTEEMLDLDPEEVFMRCCATHGVTEAQRPVFLHYYREILQLLQTA